MRTWERTTRLEYCGACGEAQADGTPVIRVQITGMVRRLIRCEKCVGEAPPELPDPVVLASGTTPMQPISATVQAAMKRWWPYKDSD